MPSKSRSGCTFRPGQAAFSDFPGSGDLHTLVIELVKNSGRGVENLLIHLTVRSDGFRKGDGNNLISPEGRHAPEFAPVHHIDSAQSVARRQDPVESAGRSAPLDVAKYDRPRFEARPLFDLARHDGADSTQSSMPEFVNARGWQSFIAVGKLGAFGCHHDAE